MLPLRRRILPLMLLTLALMLAACNDSAPLPAAETTPGATHQAGGAAASTTSASAPTPAGGEASAPGTGVPAPTADPVAVVRQYFDALNRKDAAAAAALFTDPGVWQGISLCPTPCTTRPAIQSALEPAWIGGGPFTGLTVQEADPTILVRGYGRPGFGFFIAAFTVRGPQLAAFHADEPSVVAAVAQVQAAPLRLLDPTAADWLTPIPGDLAGSLDQLFAAAARHGHAFSGAVLVAREGAVVYERGVGLADADARVANSPTTRFRIGSITKQFTAMLVLQLVARGQLQLTDTLATYVPEYPLEAGRQITLHQLLSHTSGIPNYTDSPTILWDQQQPISPAAMVEQLAARPLRFAPGTRFEYSNSNYYLLGLIIERVTGQSYPAVLQSQILDVVGMADTGYDENVLRPGHAIGYTDTMATPPRLAPPVDMSWPYAAGALFSTAEDLLRWDNALATDLLLPDADRALLFRPNLGGYAYGWAVDDLQVPVALPGRRIAHGGSIPGFLSENALLVDEHTTIILLSNADRTPLRMFEDDIINVLHDRPCVAP